MLLRLDRFLADLGIGTRKDIKQLVRSGRVKVNDIVCRLPDRKTDTAADAVSVDGRSLSYRKYVTVMMNKPAGVLSATEDGRDKTAADLLSGRYALMDLKPAGRLDKDSVGLLLMTNDGALIHGIISPARHVPKRYFVILEKPLPEGAAEAFAAGIVLEDGYRCLGAELIYTPGETRAETVVYEGKFHQVKRMFSALGSRVLYLKRLSAGPVVLDESLPEGGYRELTDGETRAIYEAAGVSYQTE